MKFLIFAASHRPESFNRKLALQAADYVMQKGADVDFADYSEFDMPLYNDAIDAPAVAAVFGQRAAKSDGIIISSPEYNWSYPGSLKNIIDWTSCLAPNPIKGKTALLMSASPGPRGGILGIDHLKSPLESIDIFIYPRAFPLGNCMSAFNEQGILDLKHSKQLHSIIDGYVTFTDKLTNN